MAESLRRQTGCANTQETEVPVQQVKEHCADGYTADSSRVTDMSDDGGIHYPDERDSDVRQYAGYRQAEYFAVRVVHLRRYTPCRHERR